MLLGELNSPLCEIFNDQHRCLNFVAIFEGWWLLHWSLDVALDGQIGSRKDTLADFG